MPHILSQSLKRFSVRYFSILAVECTRTQSKIIINAGSDYVNFDKLAPYGFLWPHCQAQYKSKHQKVQMELELIPNSDNYILRGMVIIQYKSSVFI